MSVSVGVGVSGEGRKLAKCIITLPVLTRSNMEARNQLGGEAWERRNRALD